VQDVWVEGTLLASPTLADMTPPYTPGYTAPAVAAQYSVANNAPPGTLSTSGVQELVPSQAIGLNGDTRVMKPQIRQTVDRWGNVTSVTDARYDGWTTSYRYDAGNHMVQQTQPGDAVTHLFYDRQGNQAGVLDANGHLNRQIYDVSGNVVQEIHADGGGVRYNYNAFSERVETRDAIGNLTRFTYDLLGRQVTIARLGSGAGFNVYSSGFAPEYELGSPIELGVRLERIGAIVETAQYDAAGNKISETNGAGETTQYTYDLRGNVVRVVKAGALQQTSLYDNQGRKILETNALNASTSWTYDYFGQLKAHTSLGGVGFHYTYDNARQLVQQTSDDGQVLTWDYDGAGQIVRIVDQEPAGGEYGAKVTSYAYDAAGHKIREQTVQDGIVYQDNTIAYDALGRLRWVGDSRAYVEMNYDAVGNRTRIFTHVNTPEAAHDDERFFQYDAMNRQTVVDAYDAAGTVLGDRGHILSYDQAGNRRSDTFVGTRIVADAAVQITGYDESSGAILYNPYTAYHDGGQGLVTERYGYDGAGRLKSVERDGIQTDLRFYDGAGRLLFTGPRTALPMSYFQLANGNGGGKPLPGTGTETHIMQYDSQGRLLYLRALRNDDSGNLTNKYTVDYRAPESYDAAGNLKHYVMNDRASGTVNTYDYTLKAFEGYKEAVVAGTSTKLGPGNTQSSYDANGFLTRVNDTNRDSLDRRFINDATGQALAVYENGQVLRQLIVNGEVLGRYGVAPDDLNPKLDSGDPDMVDTAEFMFGYRPIRPEYPTPAPGAYTVRSGDTLRSIAQTAYGDSRLWFQIADANGIASDTELRVGQTLTLPNIVAGTSNAAGTFQPYDPSKVVGDTTPNLPAPKPKKSSWFKQLLQIVITVIVAIYAPGLLGITNTFLAGVVGGALGALAGQVAGIAMGTQDAIDWKGVALGAIGGGVSAGVASIPGLSGSTLGATVARAAISNALTQGIGVATGLQGHFDWRGVAASAAGAGVSLEVGEAFGSPGLSGSENAPRFDDEGNLMPGASAQEGGRYFSTGSAANMSYGAATFSRMAISGTASGVASTVVRGGRVEVSQIAADAFGNALGSSIANASSNGSSPASEQGSTYDDTWREANIARMLAQANQTGVSGRVINADGSTDLPIDLAPTMENAVRRGLIGPDGQTGGVWTSPVTTSAVVGIPLPPLGSSVPLGGGVLTEGRASMNAYWGRVADEGASEGSFLKYLSGQAMQKAGSFFYDVADNSVAAYNSPQEAFIGGVKSFVRFGPDAFNAATNAVKTSLNGYSMVAEKFGAGEGTFSGFRESDPYNVTPLVGYDNQAQAGGGLLTQVALGPVLGKYGNYSLELNTGAPGTLFSNAFPIKLVAPETSASRLAVMNREGEFYPDVPDPRTGRSIPFPDGEVVRAPKADRASWDSSADRYAYIKEWHDRGYETPRGGWAEYDIHHIRPREFGGDNSFWNLVPVQRQTHRDWWQGY